MPSSQRDTTPRAQSPDNPAAGAATTPDDPAPATSTGNPADAQPPADAAAQLQAESDAAAPPSDPPAAATSPAEENPKCGRVLLVLLAGLSFYLTWVGFVVVLAMQQYSVFWIGLAVAVGWQGSLLILNLVLYFMKLRQDPVFIVDAALTTVWVSYLVVVIINGGVYTYEAMKYFNVCLHSWLSFVMLCSMAARYPFIIQYAKEAAPRDAWKAKSFVSLCDLLSGCWGAGQAFCCIICLIPLLTTGNWRYWDASNIACNYVVPYVVLIALIIQTRVYPRFVLERYYLRGRPGGPGSLRRGPPGTPGGPPPPGGSPWGAKSMGNGSLSWQGAHSRGGVLQAPMTPPSPAMLQQQYRKMYSQGGSLASPGGGGFMPPSPSMLLAFPPGSLSPGGRQVYPLQASHGAPLPQFSLTAGPNQGGMIRSVSNQHLAAGGGSPAHQPPAAYPGSASAHWTQPYAAPNGAALSVSAPAGGGYYPQQYGQPPQQYGGGPQQYNSPVLRPFTPPWPPSNGQEGTSTGLWGSRPPTAPPSAPSPDGQQQQQQQQLQNLRPPPLQLQGSPANSYSAFPPLLQQSNHPYGAYPPATPVNVSYERMPSPTPPASLAPLPSPPPQRYTPEKLQPRAMELVSGLAGPTDSGGGGGRRLPPAAGGGELEAALPSAQLGWGSPTAVGASGSYQRTAVQPPSPIIPPARNAF